jgi:hypothetical protein
LDIGEEETTEVEVISTEWWQAGRLRFAGGSMVGIPKSEITMHPTIDIKLNRGQPIDEPSLQRVFR